MDNTDTELEIKKFNRKYDEMKVTVVKKAVKLLEEDLLEQVADPSSQAYFNGRVTYLYMVSSAGKSELLTTQYLRSLHTIFNTYYQSYQSLPHGTDFHNADRERHFLYREVNDQLENFLCDF